MSVIRNGVKLLSYYMDKYLKSKMKLDNNYKEGDYDAYRKKYIL